ncbi:MAG TPA: hypothetical protein VGI22_25000 [Xanthobacteraceae bacterium]|jgi:pyruvate/2-oxoglutarate dehydrogenase complex dihydrolipoamide acyltransferase (E2) component
MDAKLSPVQADPHHDGDVVVLAPKEWTDAEEALAKLAHVASHRRRPTPGADFSAGPRVTEPLLDATLRDLKNDPLPTDRPSRGRRTSRGFARFLMMACVGVAATLAWQSYGGTAKQIIASSAPQLGSLLSTPAMDPPSDLETAVAQPSPAAVQASAPQAASAPATTVAPTASETAPPTAPSPELQQLATMAHDLAAVQQSVEQLAAGQEQMAREIAKLQTAEQDIRRRISAPSPAAANAARKPVPPPPPAPQSSATLLPPAPPPPAPQPSVAPLPPEPPRPPMPVR